MKRATKLFLLIAVAMMAVGLTSCENYPEGVPSFYSSEYRIVGSWQVSHTYLNGVEIDSTDYIGYAPKTYYYIYADHVLALSAMYDGEIRESSFATWIIRPKEKTVEFDYTFFGKHYHFSADVKRLSRREFFFEFDDEDGDHWRLELFSRSNF
ncbi:MAG: hypothetical protein K5901_00295 [Bacteroidales bacterium]|jgi:hypothetical protein|nr:hypothetical protein [Bacteroidales bacterium]